MIDAAQWTRELRDLGYRFASGVPCSSLSPLQNEILNNPGFDYVAATNEGQAVALAAGAWTGGAPSVVLMQNSGLGNAVNPLTSLTAIFQIPVLLVVSWRGRPGTKDEPQHQLMGEVTPGLLELLKIPHEIVETDQSLAFDQLHRMCRCIRETGQSHAIIVPDGSFSRGRAAPEFAVPERQGTVRDLTGGTGLSGRAKVLSAIVRHPKLDQAIRIATTGKTGRELYTLSDTARNFYMVGSMGLASSFGLGLSRQVSDDVVVIDGDGAAMMQLGALATIGAYGSKSLKHLILDNGCYDSTGGQFSNSVGVDFASIALSCGYAASYRVNCLDGLDQALAENAQGPTAIHMRITPGSMSPLGRPSVSPGQVLRRLRGELCTDTSSSIESIHA
ncbi:MAG: phosphonopyruvate decarboxylase [Pseudophaeobacter sp.]|uniref:phosphonopyruvate decarboxylase n=1 Tax=Pseudophaeobacter sp. TaxID=1971739 RepID=UPI0032974A73